MKPREEIKDIAPILSQWEHKEAYSVPIDYFANLPGSMIERVTQSKELEPYFMSLPDQVMNKIKQEDKGKVVSIRTYYKYVVAATLLLVVGTMVWSSMTADPAATTYAMFESNEDLEYIFDEIPLVDILDSEFVDDETFEEVLVNVEDQLYLDEIAEEILFYADDEILEEFL